MKSIKILVLLIIIPGFYPECVKAQGSQEMNFHPVSRINSISVGTWDTTFGLRPTTGFSRPDNRIPVRIDIKEKPNYFFTTASKNYCDLTTMPTFFESTRTSLTGKYSIPGIGIADTFNIKWAILNRKPNSATIGYYHHPTNTQKSSLSDKVLYRTSAFIFNSVMSYKYPVLSSPR